MCQFLSRVRRQRRVYSEAAYLNHRAVSLLLLLQIHEEEEEDLPAFSISGQT